MKIAQPLEPGTQEQELRINLQISVGNIRQVYERPRIVELGSMGELVQFGWITNSDYITRGSNT